MRASLGAAALLFSAHPLDAQTLPSGFVRTQLAPMTSPTRLAFGPDGRIFVAEKDGRLLVIKNAALLSTPFCTVPVDTQGERGLDGVVIDPNFPSNHYVYVYYTVTTPTAHNRLSRFTANGDVALAGSETVIVDLDPLRSDSFVHNGGALKFSSDGRLFIATGENATASNAQNLTSLLGKVLCIDVRTDGFPSDATRNYSIPSNNPFLGTTDARPEIWAYGFRNPFSMAFQPGTNRLFVNDVGSYLYEEINEGFAGTNYGWPDTEGYTTDPRFRSPLFTYNRNTGDPIGCAITGGDFYNPPVQKFPNQYLGKYFFTDYCGTWIYYLDPATLKSTPFAAGLGSLDGITTGLDGNLYYLLYDDGTGIGGVYKISYGGILSPQINTQPRSQLVSVGYFGTFTIGVDGDPPLTYQWQKNGVAIAGATSSTYTTPVVQLSDNGALFRCIVKNSWGIAGSANALLSITTKLPPKPTITSPALNTYYNAGDVISFSGSATDPQDGTLPSSALTWEVLFEHHASTNPSHHTHPFFPATGGISHGAFTVPTSGEPDPDVWYRIFLTATDSSGLSQTTFTDIFPRHAELSVTSVPSFIPVKIDGSPKASPYLFWSVFNLTHNLSVDTPQVSNGLTYDFYRWSDQGARVHDISTPTGNQRYEADFWKRAGWGTITANPNPIQVTDGTGQGGALIYWSSAQTNRVEVHVGSPSGPLLSRTSSGSFSAVTAKTVRDGTVFYLQDVTNAAPLTSEFTLDSVTVHVSTAPTGSITADPNPLITDQSALGVTNISWTSYGTTLVEVHVNAPDGTRLSGSGPGTASAKTGPWGTEGMTFYLQNVSNGLPLTAANTIAKVTLVGGGKISVSPEPIYVADGSGVGVATVTWETFGTVAVQVHLNSPSGSLFSGSGPGRASTTTGKWVADGMTFYLQDVSNGKALTAENTLATATALISTPTPTATQLGNISARVRVGTDDNVLIGGFIVTGTQPKKVILRAIGPSLPVAGKLSNPTLELYQQGNSVAIARNDNWVEAPNKQAIIESTVAPADNFESAILTTLAANNSAYTAIVRGVNGGTGVGLLEVYDLDQTANSKLANISTRGVVQTGDKVMIGGFIVLGATSQKVIIRATGPSLPVAGKLENPALELRDANANLLDSNDNWIDSLNKQAIIDSTIPPANDRESAIVRTLIPGNYTAIVRGVNNTTGVALVEVYALN